MNSDEAYQIRDALNKTVDLVYGLGVLKELRANKMDAAIELLEADLDRKVSTIGGHLCKFAPPRQELLLEMLNQVKDYRDKYPRAPNKDLLRGETLSTSDIDEIIMKAAEAAKILGALRNKVVG